MYVKSEVVHRSIYSIGLVKVLEKAIQQLAICFQSVVPLVRSHPNITLFSSPDPPHVKLKIIQTNEIESKIRLKESYLVTTVLSELVRNHYSHNYCVSVVGRGLRGRLIEMICPRAVFRFFGKV